MFGRLLPRETSFFDLFEQHAAITLEGMREFQELVSEGANIPDRGKRVMELEHEADVITHHCVEALHKTFITPMDRNDIHRLVSRMDDIMDFVEAAAERIVLYEIKQILPELRDMSDVLQRAAEQLHMALKGLRHKKDLPSVLKICIDINRLENEGDAILRNALARLFREEEDAITVIKWKEIYEDIEAATDRCEDVANIIEGMILENA